MEISAQLAEQIESRGTVQTAVRAVLFGQPNTGKSSLFNALTRGRPGPGFGHAGHHPRLPHGRVGFRRPKMPTHRHCRIPRYAHWGLVSPMCPTRKRKWDCPPWPSPRTRRADRAAQAAAAEQIARSHVRLLCLDATRPLDAWEQAELSRADDSRRIVVCTKSDAVGQGNFPADLHRELADKQPMVVTSSVTGQGLEQLRAELRRMSLGAETACGDVVPGTAARCRESLHRAGESLQNACEIARHKGTVAFLLRKNRDSPLARNSSPPKFAGLGRAWQGRFTRTTCWIGFSAGFAWENDQMCEEGKREREKWEKKNEIKVKNKRYLISFTDFQFDPQN